MPVRTKKFRSNRSEPRTKRMKHLGYLIDPRKSPAKCYNGVDRNSMSKNKMGLTPSCYHFSTEPVVCQTCVGGTAKLASSECVSFPHCSTAQLVSGHGAVAGAAGINILALAALVPRGCCRRTRPGKCFVDQVCSLTFPNYRSSNFTLGHRVRWSPTRGHATVTSHLSLGDIKKT